MEGALLAWFGAEGRDLPWRHTRDPYAILVSEVMLQQTQVERVVSRYRRWLARWPSVEALSAASPAEVIVEWQGLGYNRRALALHRAAAYVAALNPGPDFEKRIEDGFSGANTSPSNAERRYPGSRSSGRRSEIMPCM